MCCTAFSPQRNVYKKINTNKKIFPVNSPEPKTENSFVLSESCGHSMNGTRTPLRRNKKETLLSERH